MEKLFGENLKRLMIEQCLGVEELAERAGLRPYQISRWLNSDVSRVQLPTLGRISRALKIPYCDLTSARNCGGTKIFE